MKQLDASEVYPGLYQGSVPPEGHALFRAGFNALVLAAVEHQPPAQRFPGLDAVLSVPLEDAGFPPTSGEINAATKSARLVARIVRSGGTVLVTCQMGRNRSGLIVGLALLELVPDASRDEIVAAIRGARQDALTNEWFETIIATVPRPGAYRQRRATRVIRGRYSTPR